MKTRIFAIVLTIAMLLSLAACAEKTPTKTTEPAVNHGLSKPSETDLWALQTTAANANALPAQLNSANRAELLYHCSEWTYHRILPEEYLDELLQALPLWVGAPEEQNTTCHDGGEVWAFRLFEGDTDLGEIVIKFCCAQLIYRSPDGETALCFALNARPNLEVIFDLCTPRHTIPTPASMTMISPEGQTVALAAAEAAALTAQLNAGLHDAFDVNMYNEAERLRDGGYWILRVMTEECEEIEMWLDCYDSVSPVYPWCRFEDDSGWVAIGSTRDQLTALKEVLQSYADRAKQTPTQYPENDFANLLTTDFWNMTEDELTAFLTEKGYTPVQEVETSRIYYLGTLFGRQAYIAYRVGEDNLVEFLSANYSIYNTKAAELMADQLAAAPEDQRMNLRLSVQEDDYISFLTNHTLNCRSALAAGGAKLMEQARLELHGQNEQELRSFFNATLQDQLPTIQPKQQGDAILPGFRGLNYDEYYYEFPDGTVGSIYSGMNISRYEQDADIVVFLESGLKIWAADMTVGFATASQITGIADCWASYAPK